MNAGRFNRAGNKNSLTLLNCALVIRSNVFHVSIASLLLLWLARKNENNIAKKTLDLPKFYKNGRYYRSLIKNSKVFSEPYLRQGNTTP